MKCESCQTEHDGKYGSGRFCSKECAKGFSTKAKRKEISQKVSKKLTINKPCLMCGQLPNERFEIGRFCSQQCKQLYGDQRKAVSRSLRNKIAKENVLPVKKVNISRNMVDDSMPFNLLSLKNKRNRVLKNSEFKCSCCGINQWNGKPIKLEVHHINGNHADDREENLTALCPNCHSQTDNYKFTNKKHGGMKVADEELVKALLLSKDIRLALKDVGLEPRGNNYFRCYKLAALNGIKLE